ncbi:hypothetical protein JAAARDRAFT_510766 [Jaapia argillacea MUCL 33604]|uniref:histidine kinase n=1 Tax=Jaapia argillacea MUCL 33604 TaxID=933084 RepID=A0A067QD98_9AGAM|nr:hypothetical protein JAAARDRAFT_510766 [Jaapia argillacea MUCL 33604]
MPSRWTRPQSSQPTPLRPAITTSRKSARHWKEEMVPMPELGEGAGDESEKSRRSKPTTSKSTPPPLDSDDDENDDPILPPPAVHRRHSGTSSSPTKHRKTARINMGMRVHWARFKKRIGTGSAPSTSSAILGSSASSAHPVVPQTDDARDEEDFVDEVVVDRNWSEELKSSVTSEHGGSPEKSGGSHQVGGPATSTDRESFAVHAEGFWALCLPLIVLRWRVWPAILDFFSSKYLDEKSELHYRKENWFLRKNLALWSAFFYVVNWVLAIGFLPRPAVRADEIFYYGVAPAFTFPLIVMVMYDFPRDRQIFYQCFLCFSTWMWSLYQIYFIYRCGYYNPAHAHFSCNGKDFLGTFYYTSGLGTIALFGLKQTRLPHMVGALVFFLLACTMVLPDRVAWTRNMVNFVAFQGFLLYVHYMRENAERRLYTLRDQLKIQFRATQKAQVNERKAADSKRRLTSYVFHEVRVPLNTALLAVQNMEATTPVPKAQEIEFKALEGSLNMMSKVLNDVLDFNRMDSGRFESVSKPYPFHRVMRSLLVPLRLATNARNLELETEWDKNIDLAARRAYYEALGESPSAIEKRLIKSPDEDGIVVGDETRLRQIITNLASNACKFTPSGGKLSVKTMLLLPSDPPPLSPASELSESIEESEPPDHVRRVGEDCHHALSVDHLSQHNLSNSKPPPLECIVVRIEVTDTGCGIKSKDMAQSKLFSAFNQTEQGRQQGGKGTGLGLALVRQIVKLSKGRLGVQSKAGQGSTFWVELPLAVGVKAVQGADGAPNLVDNTTNDLLIETPFTGDGRRTSSYKERPSRNASALHNVMEQGGLVELIPSRPGESPVLTRTIGDTTGAMCTPEHPLQTEASSSATTNTPRVINKPSHPLVLPAPSTQQATNTATATTPPLEFEKGLNVLVVDDDPLTRMLMKRLLNRLGCHVSIAENGVLALEMILGNSFPTPSTEEGPLQKGLGSAPVAVTANEEHKYAVIFLDNQMPVMSGLEAVARLRELGRSDFVVGVTGNALLADQEEYLQAGVDRVLTKPVYEKSLKQALVMADQRRKQALESNQPTPPQPP